MNTLIIPDPDDPTRLIIDGPFADGTFLAQIRRTDGRRLEVSLTAAAAAQLAGFVTQPPIVVVSGDGREGVAGPSDVSLPGPTTPSFVHPAGIGARLREAETWRREVE